MAIFQDNRELSKQERFIGMDKVKGFKKGALAVMGYKDTGERNAWGRTGIPGMMGMATVGGSRQLAKGLAKGTDANKVMKKTDDEWLSAGVAKGKFMYESGKLAATLIAGGAGGDMVGKTTKPNLATTEIGEAATTVSTTSEVGSDIATSTAGENLMKEVDGQNLQTAKDNSISAAEEIIGTKTDGELLAGMDEGAISKEGKKLTLEEIEAAKKLKKEEQFKKATNMLDKVPLIGGVASSGLELIAAQKNYTQEAKKEAQVFKEMTAKDSRFNLL